MARSLAVSSGSPIDGCCTIAVCACVQLVHSEQIGGQLVPSVSSGHGSTQTDATAIVPSTCTAMSARSVSETPRQAIGRALYHMRARELRCSAGFFPLSEGDDWTRVSMVPMPKMSASEAKTRFGELLHRVERGEEIVITRHDRPIARVVGEGGPSLDSVRRSVEGLRQLQQRIRKRSRGRSALSLAEVRAAIGHGWN